MTVDLQIPMSIQDFDKLTEKRITEIIELQEERLKEKARRMEELQRQQEREAARRNILRK